MLQLRVFDGYRVDVVIADRLLFQRSLGQYLWLWRGDGSRGDDEERKRSKGAGAGSREEGASAVGEASNWRICRYNSSACSGSQRDNGML